MKMKRIFSFTFAIFISGQRVPICAGGGERLYPPEQELTEDVQIRRKRFPADEDIPDDTLPPNG